jgi:hypothetical protein
MVAGSLNGKESNASMISKLSPNGVFTHKFATAGLAGMGSEVL